ncbi:MAG: DsbA family protein [Cytophagaceae bacterium]
MDKPKLIYVYDPLCGWCYGFSPVMQQIKKDYETELDFEIVSGGLAIGERAAPIKVTYSYIKNALVTVEKRTGVVFGPNFREMAEEGSYMYNSEPACMALTAIKKIKPEIAFNYAHTLHDLLFRDGISLNDTNTYIELARKYKIDEHQFLKEFNASKEDTYSEFSYAKSLGVTGFPTLILQKDGQNFVLARGYDSFKNVNGSLRKILKK